MCRFLKKPITKSTRFKKSAATPRDILLHEIGHIILCEYSKIKAARLHYYSQAPNLNRIETDDPLLPIIQNIKTDDKPMMRKYKTQIKNRLMIRLAGEVLNASYDYSFEIDDVDIYNIQATPDGSLAYGMVLAAGLNYEETIYKTLRILKRRKRRVSYLFDYYTPIVANKSIVDILQPKSFSVLHFLRLLRRKLRL